MQDGKPELIHPCDNTQEKKAILSVHLNLFYIGLT